MKKIVLIATVIFVSASMYAVDIFTRTPKKKPVFKSAVKEITKEEAPKYVVPRPDKSVCPVTGVPIDVIDKTPTSVYQNTNYYFLNDGAKAQFDRNPFEFAKSIDTCVICGRQEKKARGKSSFISAMHNGVTYTFDSIMHRNEFKSNPAKYILGKENYGSKQVGGNKKPKYKPVPPPAAKTEVPVDEKKEVVVPEVKKEAVPEVKEEVAPEVKKEVVPEVKEEVTPEVKKEVVAPAPEVSNEEMIEEKTKE